MKKRIIFSCLMGFATFLPVVAVAKDYYPQRAIQEGVSGRAVIECVVQADGSLKDCRVLSETPKGYGFGKATIQLFEDQFNINQHPERPERILRATTSNLPTIGR